MEEQIRPFLNDPLYQLFSACLGSDESTEEAFDYLYFLHEGRPYHNWDHITSVVNKIKNLVSKDVIVAAFYHDCVYNPLSKVNEEMSACQAAIELAYMGVIPEEIMVICSFILATKTHEPVTDINCQYLLDADLSSLGGTWEEYYQYNLKIHEEFAQAGVNHRQWVSGRLSFLGNMLRKEKIFYTPEFEHYEAEARSNMEIELKDLRRAQEIYECASQSQVE